MRKFTVLIILFILVFCGSTVTSAATVGKKPVPKPTPPPVATYTIIDAQNQGLVSLEISGAGLENVQVKVKRTGKTGFRLIIPAGTLFANRGETQNMVATQKAVVDLATKTGDDVSVAVACINYERDAPSNEDRFDVSTTSLAADLEKLFGVISLHYPGEAVTQVAVWIVTDDISREGLDHKYVRRAFYQVFGGSPAASDEDVINAMLLLEKAGLPLREKVIFTEKISAIGALGSVEPLVAKAALRFLDINVERRLDILIDTFHSEKSFDREKAASALGRLKDIRAIDPLIAALTDEDDNVSREVRYALTQIGQAAVQPLLKALRNGDPGLRQGIIAVLGEMKNPTPNILDAIVYAMQDEDSKVREEAVVQAGLLKIQKGLQPCIALLAKDPVVNVRKAAATALGVYAAPPSVDALTGAIRNDEQEEVRCAAVTSLGEIKNTKTVPAIINALSDKSAQVRASAATALGDLGDVRSLDPLIAALNDTDDLVLEQAVGALGKLKNLRAVDPLLESWKTHAESPTLQYFFSDALRLISGKDFGDDRAAWLKWREGTRKGKK